MYGMWYVIIPVVCRRRERACCVAVSGMAALVTITTSRLQTASADYAAAVSGDSSTTGPLPPSVSVITRGDQSDICFSQPGWSQLPGRHHDNTGHWDHQQVLATPSRKPWSFHPKSPEKRLVVGMPSWEISTWRRSWSVPSVSSSPAALPSSCAGPATPSAASVSPD